MWPLALLSALALADSRNDTAFVKVATLEEAEAALSRVEASLRGAAANISRAWTGELAGVCGGADWLATATAAEGRDLDREEHVAASLHLSADTEQQHLHQQVAAAEASYTDASSLKVTTTSTLRAQYASTSDTLGTLRMVIDLIVHNTSLGDSDVVGFLRDMLVAGETRLETINTTVTDKSRQYNAVMTSAGQEVRALQEMYVDQHRTAVMSAEKLAALELQRDLLATLGAQHSAERALQQLACGEAAAGAAGFARRASQAENLTAVALAALTGANTTDVTMTRNYRTIPRRVDDSGQYTDELAAAPDNLINETTLEEEVAELPTLAPEAEDSATATRAYRGLDDSDNATQYTDAVSEAEPNLVNETTVEAEVAELADATAQVAELANASSAGLALLARPAPARTDVAAAAVTAVAAEARWTPSEAASLRSLASVLRTHDVAEDLRLLAALERNVTNASASNASNATSATNATNATNATSANASVSLDACGQERKAAAAEQAEARQKVLELQAQNATEAAGLALARAQLAVLEPALERRSADAKAARAALEGFERAWADGLTAAVAAAVDLAAVSTFCATFLNASGNTSNATAVQRVTALEALVDALQDESAERSMTLTDAVEKWDKREANVTATNNAKLATITEDRDAKASSASSVAAELGPAFARLEAARNATDAVLNCTTTSTIETSLQVAERRIVRVARAALRGSVELAQRSALVRRATD